MSNLKPHPKPRNRFLLRWIKEAGWCLLPVVAGKLRESVIHFASTKSKALKFARGFVRAHRPSQLVVFTRKGRIQYEHTYGADPKRYPS